MNIPNLITLSRLVITAGVFVCLELAPTRESVSTHTDATFVRIVSVSAQHAWVAFALFLVAAITDFVDGWLARKWNLVTAFGRVADPFADKVLIAGSLITLVQFPSTTSMLPTWYVVVVVAREFLVTAIRGVVEASGQPFPADKLGKWKMVSQCVFVASLLTLVAGSTFWMWLVAPAFWISLALTIVSGLNYLWKARDVLFRGAV